MRHKFLGIGEPGYHPLRTVFSGLRYAVIHDWSVTYKRVVSAIILIDAFSLRAWVDLLVILLATAFVVFCRNHQQRDRSTTRFR